MPDDPSICFGWVWGGLLKEFDRPFVGEETRRRVVGGSGASSTSLFSHQSCYYRTAYLPWRTGVWRWSVFLQPSVEGSGHSHAPLVGGAVPEPPPGLTVAEQMTLSDGCLCGITLKPYTLPHSLSGRLHSHHAAGKTQWLCSVNSTF